MNPPQHRPWHRFLTLLRDSSAPSAGRQCGRDRERRKYRQRRANKHSLGSQEDHQPVVLGSGEHRYRVAENWAKLPDGWNLTDVAAVAVDSKDRVYVFNRGAHPMVVLKRDGSFIKSWGEGLFKRAHGLHIDADDTLYLTDDGGHVVRKCTPAGKVLLELGTPGKPTPYMSGEPFHRCTHTALSPKGEIYVSDGYGKPGAQVPPTANEKTGASPAPIGPVQHRAQHRDRRGRWVSWRPREIACRCSTPTANTRRSGTPAPAARCAATGRNRPLIGELGPGMPVNSIANLGPRLTIGTRRASASRGSAARTARVDVGKSSRRTGSRSKGRHLSRRSRRHQLEDQLSRYADAAAVALPAEARTGQRPLKSGLRFSLKARTPSRRSSVETILL